MQTELEKLRNKQNDSCMKETACQRELALMLDKKEMALSLKDACYMCTLPVVDRPGRCRTSKCSVGVPLEKTGYTIPLRSMFEDEE